MATKTTSFHSIGGLLEAERTTGLTGHDYVADAVGSIAATFSPVDSSQVYAAWYSSYGSVEDVLVFGTSAPAFRWLGAAGYRPTSCEHSEYFVRSRHYSSTDQRWTSTDRMIDLFVASAYVGASARNPLVYADGNPLSRADYFGFFAVGSVGIPGKALSLLQDRTPLTLSDPLQGRASLATAGPFCQDQTYKVQLKPLPIDLVGALNICETCYEPPKCCKGGATVCVDLTGELGFEGDAGGLIEDIVGAVQTAVRGIKNEVQGILNYWNTGCPGGKVQACQAKSSKPELHVWACATLTSPLGSISYCIGRGVEKKPPGRPSLKITAEVYGRYCH